MISNFHAIIFEYHQLLFQFWKGVCLPSRNISDNLVRDGFRPQFWTTTEGTYPFIERDFVVLTCRYVGCGNLFWVLREFFAWDFFVLNQGKQKGGKSLVYVSAEASGSNKRHILRLFRTDIVQFPLDREQRKHSLSGIDDLLSISWNIKISYETNWGGSNSTVKG